MLPKVLYLEFSWNYKFFLKLINFLLETVMKSTAISFFSCTAARFMHEKEKHHSFDVWL